MSHYQHVLHLLTVLPNRFVGCSRPKIDALLPLAEDIKDFAMQVRWVV